MPQDSAERDDGASRDRVAVSGWRQRLARRLDPQAGRYVGTAVPTAPRTPTPDWSRVCEQFALRVLAATYQMGDELAAAEDGEQDAGRLAQLYKLDHAVTRVRRQAENLQVLAGRVVDDAGRQVTAVLDVIRAAMSAVEYYPRVHIGHVVDLAVVDFAADDLIRVLTELLDNATRFAPPTATATVSAHLTEQGSVLIRIEDAGLGLPVGQLPTVNALLAGAIPAIPVEGSTGRLGLLVVARLAAAHRMPVQLVPRPSGGTTATVLVPAPLLCEMPRQPAERPEPVAAAGASAARPPSPDAAPQALPPNTRLALVGPAAGPSSGQTAGGLPRRVGTSVRRSGGAVGPVPAGRHGTRPHPHPDPPHPDQQRSVPPHPDVPTRPADGRPADRPPDNRPPDRTPWYDDVAGFDAGFGDGTGRTDKEGTT